MGVKIRRNLAPEDLAVRKTGQVFRHSDGFLRMALLIVEHLVGKMGPSVTSGLTILNHKPASVMIPARQQSPAKSGKILPAVPVNSPALYQGFREIAVDRRPVLRPAFRVKKTEHPGIQVHLPEKLIRLHCHEPQPFPAFPVSLPLASDLLCGRIIRLYFRSRV